jgi:hypothetical protein
MSDVWKLANELGEKFFVVSIFRHDYDTAWSVQCEPRHGDGEPSGAWWVTAPTANKAIRKAHKAWKNGETPHD